MRADEYSPLYLYHILYTSLPEQAPAAAGLGSHCVSCEKFRALVAAGFSRRETPGGAPPDARTIFPTVPFLTKRAASLTGGSAAKGSRARHLHTARCGLVIGEGQVQCPLTAPARDSAGLWTPGKEATPTPGPGPPLSPEVVAAMVLAGPRREDYSRRRLAELPEPDLGQHEKSQM